MFLLIWLLIGVFALCLHLLFGPLPVSGIKAAIPRRAYLVGLHVVSSPAILALFASGAITVFLETASIRSAWGDFVGSIVGHWDDARGAWHGR